MSTAYEQTLQSIANQAGNRREFLERFIDHAIQEFDVLGGMFWDCTSNERKPICQHYRGDETLKLGCSSQQHDDFLRQACESPEPLLVSANQEDEQQNTAERFPTILLVSITHGGRTEVVELFFAVGKPRDEVETVVGPLAAMSRAASVHGMPSHTTGATNQREGQPLNSSLGVTETEAFIHSLHQSLDLNDNARTIANETRRFLNCDRVSVVEIKGARCRTLAISGQPSVNRRSNAVRMLEKVVNKVVPVKQLFWYPSASSIPPQIDDPLQEYLANSATRTMVVVPVFDRIEDRQLQVDVTREPARLIGGIVIEHCREQWDQSLKSPIVELATRHGSNAFRSSWNHQSLFLYSIWKWLGKSKVVFAARHLPKTVAAVLALAFGILALTLLQTDFELTCDGSLIPEHRQMVFPESPGVITDVLVGHGQRVSKGEPLVKMTDLNLDYQLAEIKGQINEVEETIRSIKSSRLKKQREEESLQKENLKSLQAQLESLNEQQRIYRQLQDSLLVTSPLSGQVMTWEVRKRLQNRSVGVEGQLMEIADVDGEWILELDLPDRKVGHFMKRWQEARKNDEAVKVEFILAAEPGETHIGQIKSVGTSTQINAANEHHLKILVDVDVERLDVRKSGSGVNAKIDCGKASLGYVWFHPVKEFFQSKILFPFW